MRIHFEIIENIIVKKKSTKKPIGEDGVESVRIFVQIKEDINKIRNQHNPLQYPI